MAKQPTVSTIASGFYSTSALNTNFENIRDQFDNTLSLDGSTPNAMNADFDLNSQDLLNGRYVYSQRLYINGVRVTAPTATPTWQGEWATTTSYAVDALARNDGNVYICIEAHTSGTFSTDLAANKWELFAAKGSAGAGTGDLLAANNLSDVSNADTALANLGGGTVGIAIFKDTTAAAVRTEIGAQQQGDILDDLSGLTQATDKVPYFDSATTAATLDLLDEDDMSSDSASGVPTQQSVKAYVDNLFKFAHFRDQRTSGTGGDGRSGSSWAKHTLQTTVLNNITSMTLSSSVISAPAGTYKVDASISFDAASSGNNYIVRLRDTTNNTTLAMSANGDASGSGDGGVVVTHGVFTLAGTANLELQYWQTSTGGWTSTSNGDFEVGADILLQVVG